jgi:micrococcal nuclease
MVDYKYKAKCLKVVDGDTVDLEVDVGFKMSFKHRFRLAKINAPEIRGEESENGLKTKDWLTLHILGEELEIYSYKDKDDKYGRYLATIFFEGEDINQKMVDLGLAKKYE